jgi:hypothetical protein
VSWWDDGIVARETTYYHADIESGIEGWIIRWDTAWGYNAVGHETDPESVTPARLQQWAIDAAFLPDVPEAVKLRQRQEALLQLQHIAIREGFGYLYLPPLHRTGAPPYPGFRQQYVKLVAQPS